MDGKMNDKLTILTGDCRETLKTLPDASVHCAVTSPPYFGLRQYFADAVKLRDDLTPEQRQNIIKQLEQIGVFPVPHTSE
jgi:DNA modification methylase